MIYKFISNTLAWIFPSKNDRNKFRALCKEIEARKSTKIIQQRYKKHLKKLQTTNNKIRILFLINEISKWKTQSLYDLLKKSEYFEPIIALTISDIQVNLPQEKKREILIQNFKYFQKKGIKCKLAYDLKSCKPINLKYFNPQIVFYQQPYKLSKIQNIKEVSKYALTCYVPYYLPDYRNYELDCEKEFHRFLYRFYVLDKSLENTYKSHLKKVFNIEQQNIVGVGHTSLDNITTKGKCSKYVIYAPHWSIFHKNNENSINISTFDSNGKLILEYAKKHPEISWVFKPHPTLKTALLKSGFLNEEDINNYYAEWETVSQKEIPQEYTEIFNNSKALITDCGSFLLEYFCTGKPLIHLVSSNCENPMYPQLQHASESFYSVKTNNALLKTLDNILIKNNDYLKSTREHLLAECSYARINAAKNILNDLIKETKKI